MKKLIVLHCVVLVAATRLAAQVPVHFSYSAKKIDDTHYELHVTATMDNGWHIYSASQPKEAVAVPTKIVFKKNPLVALSGQPNEVGKKEKFENKEVGIVQYQYGGTVDFVQAVTLKAKVQTSISGSITYQVCTDEECLPPKTVPFDIKIE